MGTAALKRLITRWREKSSEKGVVLACARDQLLACAFELEVVVDGIEAEEEDEAWRINTSD